MGFLTSKEKEDKLKTLNQNVRMTMDPYLFALREGKFHIPGKGSLFPRVLFVGEAPGRVENLMREPFKGESGEVLDHMLNSVGLKRKDVYLTYMVKWWPTVRGSDPLATRIPTRMERDACRFWLMRELEILGVRKVVALGKSAARIFLPHVHARGRWQKGVSPFEVLPLYHPSVALYNTKRRPELFKEFEAVLT